VGGEGSTTETLRRIAVAGLIGSAAALVCDVLLRAALGLVSVDGSGSSTSWILWSVLSHLAWPIAAALLWLAAPAVASGIEGGGLVPALRASPAAAIRLVGVSMIAVPIVWLLAASSVRGLVITINRAWATDGRIFWSQHFYADLVLAYGPWVLAGMALAAASQHMYLGRP
jgi:hypothetical protein